VRIAYDVTPLSHPRTGVGNYILGALKGMLAASGGMDELIAFGPVSIRGRKLLDEALNGLSLERRIVTVPFAHATRRAWGVLGRPSAERFLGEIDVLHFSDWMVPPQRRGVRATMIHDLGPLHYPERLHPRTVRMHTATAREAARCDVVFVNSNFTANDVVARLGIPVERVRVAYPGVAPVFTPEGPGFDGPFIFSTATHDWRKNLVNLRRAYELLDTELPLFTIGDFHFRLTDDHLARFYRGATVFVYPSLFEGFGMPVIEAMASGAPCVVSSHPSLDEASGDAAIRVDPQSPKAIAAGIEEALDRREDLVARGLEHARRFSWVETGRIHLRSYADAL
jgi:glycosyltransferase involved in cell wall biosynthesis